MFQMLIQNLATLIVTVRKNVFSSVMTTFMILVIIVVWSARGNIAAWLDNNPTAQEQTDRLARGSASDRKIERTLRDRMIESNADRLLIRQFSNQTEPRSNTVIPYVTTTHIVSAPGVSPPVSGIVNIPRSYLVDITGRMYADPNHPVCVHALTSEISDEIYRNMLRESGVYDQYMCPITDLEGAPVGFIAASYLTATKTRPSQEQLFSMLSDTAVRVAGYLNEVRAPEEDPWYRRLLKS